MSIDQEQHHEAHLPAQQSPAGEDARLPGADADAGWAGDLGRASVQGALSPVGLVHPVGFLHPVCFAIRSTRMLPLAHRLRRSTDIRLASREGMRARRGAVVVLLRAGCRPQEPVRVGFAVGRSVGNSVQRHRVTRRLRAAVAAELDRIPLGSDVLVRALPESSQRAFPELRADVAAALAAATLKATEVQR